MTNAFVQQVEQVLANLMLHERRYSAFALAPRVAAAIEAAAFGNLCHEREAALSALKGSTALEKSGALSVDGVKYGGRLRRPA